MDLIDIGFYRPRVALAKQGYNVASVRSSVRPTVRQCALSCKVDIRGSASLPSPTKSKEESLSVQDVCLCV